MPAMGEEQLNQPESETGSGLLQQLSTPCHSPEKQMGYQQYQYLKGRAWTSWQAQAQCSYFHIALIFTIFNKTEVDTSNLNSLM